MNKYPTWRERAAALPLDRRADEMECPECNSMDLKRGPNWIECDHCRRTDFFEPDEPDYGLLAMELNSLLYGIGDSNPREDFPAIIAFIKTTLIEKGYPLKEDL